MTRCLKRAHGCSSSLLSAISNSPLRGFNPPPAQRADCLESGSQGSEETGGYPHRECIEAGEGAGGADDQGNQRQVKTKAQRYFSGVGYQLLDVWVKWFVGEENAQQRSMNVRRAGINKAQMG